jgi:hypothetical protein
MLTDMPYKILNAIAFNVPLYFMANLRRAPGPFFYFLLGQFHAYKPFLRHSDDHGRTIKTGAEHMLTFA